jgi:cardiolipin synthase
MASRILTVPNQLTFLRLAFLPFFFLAIFSDRYDWALAVLLAAALSDALDGLLARWLNQKTALGAYLDPIADKLLITGAFILLAMKGKIGWWLTILVLSRDVFILAVAAAIILVSGYRPFPPSLYGKATTSGQFLLVLLLILNGVVDSGVLELAGHICVWVVAALTIVSGVHYSIVIARRISAG